MHLSWKDIKKYVIFTLIFIWLLLFSHLFYLYSQEIGKEQAVKWWVFIEWIVSQPVNPIPYLWNNYYSKYIQSLLFGWCLNSYDAQQLCSVSTNDYKTFNISLAKDTYWSDGRKLTLDDVYFTYNDILKDNAFQLENQSFTNIENITKQDDNLIVTLKRHL
jgi:ABC-type transport system substrate-binding protein